MAQLATGIISGQMPWGLIVMGMFFTIGLIMISAPSPMLIAVGMYLPFETTFAIFIGGTMKWLVDKAIDRLEFTEAQRSTAESKGVLLASGFIAGEALTGVLLAGLVMVGIPSLSEYFFGVAEPSLLHKAGGWLSLILFATVAYCLIKIPLKRRS